MNRSLMSLFLEKDLWCCDFCARSCVTYDEVIEHEGLHFIQLLQTRWRFLQGYRQRHRAARTLVRFYKSKVRSDIDWELLGQC